MSNCEAAYALLVVQVTLLSVMAGGAYLATTRRHPATGKRVLGVTVLLLLGLTATAGLPLPASWSLDIWPAEAAIAATPEPPAVANAIDRDTATGVPAISWTRIVNAVSITVRPLGAGDLAFSQPTGAFRWTLLVKLLLLAGGTVAGTRLIRGLWSTHRVLSKSREIDDVEFVGFAEEIGRAIGCRPVALRVSTEISSAATVGWRRPVLIVAADWRQWSEQEKRAVLAHELAHVRSNDYLTGLVARITVALYFYHPVVRWLGANLFVAQEVAADAAATRFVGGRENYVAVLSRIALRQDREAKSVPALAFVPPSSTFLMRRIEMLQTKDGRRSPLTHLVQGATLACICLGAVALSALRAPAEEDKAGSQAPVRTARKQTRASTPSDTASPVQASSTTDEIRPPINLRHVRGFEEGVIAIRPSTVLGRPEMATTADQLDKAFRQYLGNYDVPDQQIPSLAEISQVAGRMHLTTRPGAEPGNRHALNISLGFVRSTNVHPWKDLFETVVPGTEVKTHQGLTVLDAPHAPVPAIAPVKSFALPDPYTIMPFWPPEVVPVDPSDGEDPLESVAWKGDWGLVQQSTICFAMDNSAFALHISEGALPPAYSGHPKSEILAHPEKCTTDEYLGCLTANVEHTVCGIDWRGDYLSVLSITEFQSPQAAIDAMAGLPELIEKARATVAQARPEDTRSEAILRQLAIELLDQIEFRSIDSKVLLSTATKLTPDLVAACLLTFAQPGE